jgi:hypothetical protein
MRAIFVTCSSFLIHSLCKTNERRMHLLEHFINAHKPLFLQSFMCSSMIIWTFSLTRVVLSLHPLTVFCTLLQYSAPSYSTILSRGYLIGSLKEKGRNLRSSFSSALVVEHARSQNPKCQRRPSVVTHGSLHLSILLAVQSVQPYVIY